MCGTRNCGCLAIILGAILGIIIGILFFIGSLVFTNITIIILIALGVAVFTLVALWIRLVVCRKSIDKCLCENAVGLVISSILVIFFSIAALSVTLVAASIASAVILGLGAAALIANLVLLACLLICYTSKCCKA